MRPRFRVVYRLAGKVYVMAVAPAHSNVFFATRIVNAAVHYLVSVNRGINITAEKIASRFPDVRHHLLLCLPRYPITRASGLNGSRPGAHVDVEHEYSGINRHPHRD